MPTHAQGHFEHEDGAPKEKGANGTSLGLIYLLTEVLKGLGDGTTASWLLVERDRSCGTHYDHVHCFFISWLKSGVAFLAYSRRGFLLLLLECFVLVLDRSGVGSPLLASCYLLVASTGAGRWGRAWVSYIAITFSCETGPEAARGSLKSKSKNTTFAVQTSVSHFEF